MFRMSNCNEVLQFFVEINEWNHLCEQINMENIVWFRYLPYIEKIIYTLGIFMEKILKIYYMHENSDWVDLFFAYCRV